MAPSEGGSAGEPMPPPKQDMTSLFDVVQRETESATASGHATVQDAMEMPAFEPASDADFGSLEELSQQNIAEEFKNPPPVEAQEPSEPALPVVEHQYSSLDSPVETSGEPQFDGQGFAPLPDLAQQSAPGEGLEPLPGINEPLQNGDQLGDLASGSVVEQAVEQVLDAPQSFAFVETFVDAPPTEAAREVPQEFSNPNFEPVVAPPPQAVKTKKPVPVTPLPTGKDLRGVQQMAERVAIGRPRIEASPPFSVMISLASTADNLKRVEEALTSEDFGLRYSDVEIQLQSGKLFVPKISEFAAITLAQKLRDVADDIRLGLSEDIYKSKTLNDPAEIANEAESGRPRHDFENIFLDSESFHNHEEEIHDLSAEPKNERDLFTTHLTSLEGYRITRVLTALSVSKVVSDDVVDDLSGKKLEPEFDQLMRQMVTKAFKLGAHGLVGVAFSLKSNEIVNAKGRRKVYRAWGVGTAVRALKLLGSG